MKMPNKMTFKNLGPLVTNFTMHSGTAAKGKGGKSFIYFVGDGVRTTHPAKLFEVDADTGAITGEFLLPMCDGSWKSAVSSDGRVYVGTYPLGKTFRFDPLKREFLELGGVGSEKFAYGMCSGANGDMYCGTYPNAMLYKISADGKTERLSDCLKPGENYSRGCAAAGGLGAVFAGIGAHTDVMMYDVINKTAVSILPDEYKNGEFAYDLAACGSYLLVKCVPQGDTLKFKISRTDGLLKAEYLGVQTSGENLLISAAWGLDGNMYFIDGGFIYRLNGDSGECEKLEHLDPITAECPGCGLNLNVAATDTDAGLAMASGMVTLEDQERFPGETFVSMRNGPGCVILIYNNIETGNRKTLLVSPGQHPTHLRSIALGPGNKIYGTAYLVGGLGVYTPGSAQPPEQLKGVGQSENIICYKGKMYFGIYPGGHILEYDPEKPFSPGANPVEICGLKKYRQDRPFGMAAGGDKLFVGTLPDYGRLDSALTIIDLKTRRETALRDPAHNLSLINLLYSEGKVYAGTAVFGGMGIMPTEKNAKLYVYDTESGQGRTFCFPAENIYVAGGLLKGPDGLIWGMANGCLFKFSPAIEKFVYFKDIFQGEKWPFTMYTRNGDMVIGNDGFVYLNIKGSAYRIDPDDMSVTRFGVGGSFNVKDKDGSMYSISGTDLLAYIAEPQE